MLETHGVDPDRRLGQNFVTDTNMLRRIVSLADIGPDSHVLEIGPGIGCLTLALVEAGAAVTAIEKDPSLLPVLDDVLSSVPEPDRPHVVNGDALETDWEALLSSRGDADSWKVVANLPYNVAVPIITGLLEGAPSVHSMWVMVQLEVAERICATPGGRDIGVPSIRVGWFADASIATTVPPEVFTPRPRVRSAVVELQRREPPHPELDPQAVFDLVGRAYRKRRKMLRSSLAGEVAPAVFEVAGIDPRNRPEELSVADWGRLAAAVS
ncbi:MAG: 16S rRNA (adenine(1518)-N(6)/adenine(1519)-N(6))-dimethyltransferase RsmA [Microthrixaceae bacterium]